MKTFLGFCLSNLRCNWVNEFIKTDWFVLILKASDESQNEWISLINTKFFKSLTDLSSIYSSTSIFIKNFKSEFKFFIVLSIKAIFPSSGLGDLSWWCGSLDCVLVSFCSSTHNKSIKSYLRNSVCDIFYNYWL